VPVDADSAVAHSAVNRCLKCGASDATFDGAWLTCTFCRYRWNTAVIAKELHLSDGIADLVGTTTLDGAVDIDTHALVTLKCSGCGAEVTLNTEKTLSATCHWCRHVLSMSNAVESGTVPDAILPFHIAQDDALNRMRAYVSERGTHLDDAFVQDFSQASLHAVYLPYLVVDGRVTVRLDGVGWVRKGRRRIDKSEYEYYSDEYNVTREADLLVDDLAIEARSTRTRIYSAVSTTNILNAVQPFDIENAVRFNAHYLTAGTTFEKRDLSVNDAMSYAADHFATMARGYVGQTVRGYTGGVRWESEQVAVKGTRWLTVLLPVWIYAYYEQTPRGTIMHYIAVNGRSGETQGSLPMNMAKIKRSANLRGWAVTSIGLPVLALTIPFFMAAGVEALRIVMFPLIFTGIAALIGFTWAHFHKLKLIERHRNAQARYLTEYEVRYEPTRCHIDDRFRSRITTRGGPIIDRRNDADHAKRADYWRAFLTDEVPPPPVE